MQTLRFLILITLSATAWAEEGRIAECLNVENSAERLACYDERARAFRQEREGQQESQAKAATPSPTVTPTQTEQPVVGVDVPAPEAVAPEPVATAPDDFGRRPEIPPEDFGRSAPKPTKEAKPKPQQLTARIESIGKGARGNHVMTLSNGQVWSENEPNIRGIKAGQDVTITKRRLAYLMHLESGRNVAVSRIDDN